MTEMIQGDIPWHQSYRYENNPYLKITVYLPGIVSYNVYDRRASTPQRLVKLEANVWRQNVIEILDMKSNKDC